MIAQAVEKLNSLGAQPEGLEWDARGVRDKLNTMRYEQGKSSSPSPQWKGKSHLFQQGNRLGCMKANPKKSLRAAPDAEETEAAAGLLALTAPDDSAGSATCPPSSLTLLSPLRALRCRVSPGVWSPWVGPWPRSRLTHSPSSRGRRLGWVGI